MQKEVKPTGLTSLKGLKVSPFNESENSKGVKVKPLIDRNNFVEKNKGIKVNPLHNVKSCTEDEISPNTESDYMENYKPFISEGVVSLVGDENSSQKVKILRDTGATQSIMLDSVLPLTENSFTVANVLISGVEMGYLEVPLHEVNIKSSLINGNIVIGMRPSLPVQGISLILGNDLAGEKVMVDPRVVEKPRDDEKTERLAEKFFSHIIFDCVGPLPKTKSQNEYLLTIMCSSTRFPEAIPLRSIKTNTILKALIKFVTLFGLPKSIQSD